MIIIIIIIASSSSWFDEKTAGEMSFWIVFAGLSVVVLPPFKHWHCGDLPEQRKGR